LNGIEFERSAAALVVAPSFVAASVGAASLGAPSWAAAPSVLARQNNPAASPGATAAALRRSAQNAGSAWQREPAHCPFRNVVAEIT